jgi:hypothetical protein
LFLWQFDGFFRKPLEDFPLSSIFNIASFVHYQMHIRMTHNRSRRFHISVETTFSYQCGNKFIIRAHFSSTYQLIFDIRIQST